MPTGILNIPPTQTHGIGGDNCGRSETKGKGETVDSVWGGGDISIKQVRIRNLSYLWEKMNGIQLYNIRHYSVVVKIVALEYDGPGLDPH